MSLLQPAQAPTAEGQDGEGDCPSSDAVNAIYCWQFKKESDCCLRRLISTALVDKPCKTLLVSRKVEQ